MTRITLQISVFIALFTVLACSFDKNKEQVYPSVVLKNSKLEATVLLPDSLNGYYRSTRYDWSGIIAQVKVNGHSFFQDWQNFSGPFSKEKHDPTKAGTGTGTIEEFRVPIGYDEAKVGEGFVKIGVGILQKASLDRYHWDYPYKILKLGKWDCKVGKHEISFVQELTTKLGYAYHYKKTIFLHQNQTKISIVHTLTNKGLKPISSRTYCHNFFNFDGRDICSDYEINFPSKIFPVAEFHKDILFQKNKFKLICDSVQQFIGGHIIGKDINSFTLLNTNTKTSVKVKTSADYSPFYICMWDKAICPEPMVQFSIKPMESCSWTRTYEFKSSKYLK